MAEKIIELSTPGTRLSVRHAQLVIDRPSEVPVTVPIEDIGVLVVDDVRASYTQSVFIELLSAGAVVVISGRNHLPAGLLHPLSGHHEHSARHRVQIEASRPRFKRAWQQLVQRKITLQGTVLELVTESDHGMYKLAARVRSGDPENREAQAAQRYWPRLFGRDFRRDRERPGINAMLNYSYAILRASLARSIVAAGLIPVIGLHHRNRRNPFCLADDLLEPFRPIVDACVHGLASDPGSSQKLDRETRAGILSLLNTRVETSRGACTVSTATARTARSLVRFLSGTADSLELPASLPLIADGKAEAGKAG